MKVVLVLSFWFLIDSAPWAVAQMGETNTREVGPRATVADPACFENLEHLQDEMEILLKSVYVKEFREAIRRSLTASIPEAVNRIDGLKGEIESLRREILHQNRVEKSAEVILQDITKSSDSSFKPCRRTEKGGYCETLERYYMAKAANLANRGFLQALECYQKKGSP